MNRAAADERRAGNEESGGAAMSGAERVEPEVSRTPAKPRNNVHTKMSALCARKLFYSLTGRAKKEKKIQWNLNNPWS